MAKGKGKEVATKPDWKDQLAMLDQEMGWDGQESSDWADSSEAEKQEVFTPNRPRKAQHISRNFTDALDSIEQDNFPCFQTERNDCLGATMTDCDQVPPHDAQKFLDNGRNSSYYDPSDSLEDEEVTSAEIQMTIWEAAVEESRSAAQQQQREEEEKEVPDEQQRKEEGQFQPKSKLEKYLHHRFGPDLNYKDRCWCHEYLHDSVEEGKQYKREYFARAGTVLIKDPCVLLPYPQDDIPGTEDVEKPVLMITIPEGEALYPHDVEEYPEPAAATWHGSRLGWGGRTPPQGERYVVPYEDEDEADI